MLILAAPPLLIPATPPLLLLLPSDGCSSACLAGGHLGWVGQLPELLSMGKAHIDILSDAS